MLYHGSNHGDIKTLKPNYSMHGKKYVYLSTLREVALIYTVNSIEKYYEDNHLDKPIEFHNWYSYGFSEEKPYLSEYYPNAIKETYSGKSGYIYTCKEPMDISNPTHIYCARVCEEPVIVEGVEYIEDVYKEFLKLEEQGLIELRRYKDNSDKFNRNIHKMIREDIKKYNLLKKPLHNYSVFLKAKFPILFKQN